MAHCRLIHRGSHRNTNARNTHTQSTATHTATHTDTHTSTHKRAPDVRGFEAVAVAVGCVARPVFRRRHGSLLGSNGERKNRNRYNQLARSPGQSGQLTASNPQIFSHRKPLEQTHTSLVATPPFQTHTVTQTHTHTVQQTRTHTVKQTHAHTVKQTHTHAQSPTPTPSPPSQPASRR